MSGRVRAREVEKEMEKELAERILQGERLEKADTLREAETLEELKDWIVRYVL